jgi:hypothetical protein
LLDFEPFELPTRLADTYSLPADPADIVAAAWEIADLLRSTSRAAGEVLGQDLSTPWRAAAESRLQTAGHPPGSE